MKLLEIKRLKSGLLILFVVLFAALGILPDLDNPSRVYAVPGEINIADGTITINATDYSQNGVTVPYTGDYVITGTSTTNFIQVSSGTHNMTISDLTVDVSAISSCFAFFIQSGANVNLTLQGENLLRSGYYRAGLSVISGAGLTITSESTGSLSSYGNMAGAGIGGNWGAGTSGTIIINGGTVNAIGSDGAGIGGGKGGSNGTVIINGGTVNAIGSYSGGAGIGGGEPDLPPYVTYGGCGNITINGGTVTAEGGNCSIGPGFNGAAGTIVFNGGSIKASYISGTPVNASNQPVYKTTLTLLGREINTLTSDMVIQHGEVAYAFGGNGMTADSQGKLYMYLPQNNADTNIHFQANGAAYAYVLPAAQSGSNNAAALRTAPLADSIAITAPANKLTYKVGESLSVTGMVVTGSYNGYQQSIPVSAANVTGFNSSTEVDSQTLTVTLEGRTTTYTITIIPALSSLAITTPATKLTYRVGESLDITGLVVTGTYTDGSTQVVPITTANVYWFDSSFPGTQTLKVQVENKFTTYQITIIAPRMYIYGNGSTIYDDDVTPSSTDDTDFGSADILIGSVTKTFTIRNFGSAPLTLSGTPKVAVTGANASEFTVTALPADTVAVNSSTTFKITFDPNTTGLRTADITIANDDPFSNPYNFTIQGTGTAAPEIALEGNSTTIADGDVIPSSSDHTDFGSTDLIIGTVTRTFTIKNTGSATLALTGIPKVSVEGFNAADFIVTAEPSATVEVAGSTTFQITFDPSAVGVRTATIRIANDDSDENPFDFTIQGTGTVSPEMDITGNGISIADGDTSPSIEDHTDFGSSDIQGSVVTRTFTVINSGSADLTLNGIPKVIVEGTHASDFVVTVQPSSATITPADSTTFQVTFDPSAAGLRTASIRIANDDSDENPYTFTIQGTGTTAPEINIKGNSISIADGDSVPNALDHTEFGSANLTSGSVTRTFTIENSGSGSLTLTGIPAVTVSGAHAGDFSVTAQPANLVDPSGTTTFEVTFDPGAEGLRTATISIANDDSNENPYIFDIQGTGTVKPEIDIQGNGISITDGDTSPSSSDHTDFGSSDVANGTVERTFTLKNTGDGELTLSGLPVVTLSGDDAADFSVIALPANSIPAGGSTTFKILFDPSGGGIRNATVHIESDDPDEAAYDFAIKGTGTYPSAAQSSSQQYTPAQMAEMTRTGQTIQIECGSFIASMTPGDIPQTNGQTIAIQMNAITDVTAINTFFLSYPQQKGVMRAYQLVITGEENDQTKPISQLNDEITLRFKLSAEDINGINPSTLAVYKRGDDGSVTKLDGVYDWQTGTLSARTSHLCQFFIMGKEGTPTERLAGANRYATAVAISQKGWRTSDCVILTSGENFPDALAGTVLASVKSAPVLLTSRDFLNKETQAEITRLQAKQIVILGGTSVISQQIEDKLAKDYAVIRISGVNRYETAVHLGNRILQEAGTTTADTVVLAAGMNYPDALSVAAYAGYHHIPILFTDGQALSDETVSALKEWQTKQVILIGGQRVISVKVEDILKEEMNLTVTRLSGTDRYLTSLAVTRYFEQYGQDTASTGTARYDEASLATGENFPDALAGAALAAKQNMPLLLAKKQGMSAETQAYLNAMNLMKLTLFGGEGVI